MANLIAVKAFRTPYDQPTEFSSSASATRYIAVANIQDLIPYTDSRQTAIKSKIFVKYVSGRELRAGTYLVNDTVAALVTAIG